jgi:phosphatidate cytidylyltransferase
VVVAAVGIPPILLITVTGGNWFTALVGVVGVLGVWEISGLVRRAGLSSLGMWAWLATGAAYIVALLAAAILLRARPDGLGWVLVILVGTWACDTAAFLVGRTWGRHRLARAVSPTKTIEGAVAGLVAAALVGSSASWLLAQPLQRTLGLGLVVGAAAIAGDLIESAFKRRVGAKDSGWLVPGHGGLLDRVDSLLVAMFLGYWYVTITDGGLST